MKCIYNEQDPIVTVIIPVYNVLPYFKDTIESVIKQTYYNLEIIIIDDGSTDGSEVICDEYLADKRVRVIHQENKGLSKARNVGLDLMSGEYVVFLDADDFLLPQMIQTMIDTITQYSADIVISGYSVIPLRNQFRKQNTSKYLSRLYRKEELDSVEAQNRLIDGEISYHVWNKIYRSDLWENMRFPEGYVYEDAQVVIKLMEKSSRIITIPEILITHRKRKGSITETNTLKNIQDQIFSHEYIEDYIRLHTPAVFSHISLETTLEKHARIISLSYSRLLYSKCSNEEIKVIKDEANKRWRKLNLTTLTPSSKVIYYCFKFFPYLLFPLAWCYRVYRNTF